MRRIRNALLSAVGVALVATSCGNKEGTVQMPPQATEYAADVDALYYFIYWISVVSFVLIVGFMLYFAWKYRMRPGHKAVPTGHATLLEIFWTFSPLILLAVMFHWGFVDFVKGAIPPSNSLEVGLYGSQWKWTYEHGNGGTDNYNLVVPAGQPVKLTMSSSDVIHSYFIPDFRVKRDVVPGMFTSLWFDAPAVTFDANQDPSSLAECDPADPGACAEGSSCRRDLRPNRLRGLPDDSEEPRAAYCYPAHQVFCTEYCGAPFISNGLNEGHSAMYGAVHVVTQEEYEVYLDTLLDMPSECKEFETDEEKAACWGETLYASNQCNTCHSVDGSPMAGPTFAGLWGRTETMTDGTQVEVIGEEGEEYLAESILRPQAMIVAGVSGVMPAQRMNSRQIDAIVSYIKSLSEQEGAEL